MIKYILTGLPRSGTTWLSVFLSTDDCVCLHDPIAEYTPEELSKWEGGISDTGLWFFDDWCRAYTDKFILIKRDIPDVIKGLEEKGLPALTTELYSTFLEKIGDKEILFSDLFKESTLKDLWEYVHPDKPFNQIRYNQLKQIYMSPMLAEELYEKSKTSTTV